MKVNNIQLKNFRNYEKLDVDFCDKINIFIGDNGAGKTNILESIYVLAITKSHRSYIDKCLITNNMDFMKIVGNVTTLNGNKTLELIMSDNGKKVSVNKNIERKISNYISNLLVVLFTPDDLDLIKDSPGVRRKFLNIEIGQFDNKYLNYLNDYNELLRNRNEYLKSISFDNVDKIYLDIINKQLCKCASYIYKYRFEFINKLNINLKKIYNNLSNDNLEIKYVSNIDCVSSDDSLESLLLDKLEKGLKRDIVSGSTNYGPHKDDFDIYLNGYNLKEYGSQGQQRLAVLGIKFSEIEIFNEKTGEYPILLLDDMFSELDINKRNMIVNYLNNDIQVIITSTDINDIDTKLLENAKVFNIKDGNIV